MDKINTAKSSNVVNLCLSGWLASWKLEFVSAVVGSKIFTILKPFLRASHGIPVSTKKLQIDLPRMEGAGKVRELDSPRNLCRDRRAEVPSVGLGAAGYRDVSGRLARSRRGRQADGVA